MNNTFIRYQGELAAIASPLRVHFAPPFDAAGDEDPGRRFVYAMALFANDVGTGELEVPYTDAHAEAYARAFLMPAAEFASRAHARDDELAAHFQVPLEQVARRRAELP